MKMKGWGANFLRVNEVGSLCWAVLTWALVAFSVLQIFRGQGQHFWWVLVAVALPAPGINAAGIRPEHYSGQALG